MDSAFIFMKIGSQPNLAGNAVEDYEGRIHFFRQENNMLVKFSLRKARYDFFMCNEYPYSLLFESLVIHLFLFSLQIHLISSLYFSPCLISI